VACSDRSIDSLNVTLDLGDILDYSNGYISLRRLVGLLAER